EASADRVPPPPEIARDEGKKVQAVHAGDRGERLGQFRLDSTVCEDAVEQEVERHHAGREGAPFADELHGDQYSSPWIVGEGAYFFCGPGGNDFWMISRKCLY